MNIKKVEETIEELSEELKEQDEQKRLVDIHRDYRGSDQIISATAYQKAIKKDKVLYKVASGIKDLDRIIEGFRPGNVIVISGPTKQGKTTLCQTLTNNFTKQGFPCLWFSFDTPAIEVIERFEVLPIFYLPRRNKPEKKIEWVEAKIIEGLAKYNTRMIFIDHLGFLSRYTDSSQTYATELTSIVRELKEISIRWNVTIFLNHHIRSIGSDITPNWGHLKDSSGPAQDSDITIMIWRGKEKGEHGVNYVNHGYVSVQLHRRTGRTGTIKVNFKKGLFYDFETKSTKR